MQELGMKNSFFCDLIINLNILNREKRLNFKYKNMSPGILAIALEDKIKINKAAIALFMAISLWMILMFDAYDIFVERSSPLFQEFLTQNPEMANAPLKDQFITFITKLLHAITRAS